MQNMDIIIMIGIVIFGAGVVLDAIGGLSFRLRAVMNKPAWGGLTGKVLVPGIILTIIGLIITIVRAMMTGQLG